MKNDESNRIRQCFAAAALIAFSGTGWGQSLPGFLEGPLTDLDVVDRTARINGVVVHIPEGTPIVSPTGVDVYIPGSDDGAGGCNGTLIAATAVDAIGFDWDFRSDRGAFPSNPGSVCVVSPRGGSAEGRF